MQKIFLNDLMIYLSKYIIDNNIIFANLVFLTKDALRNVVISYWLGLHLKRLLYIEMRKNSKIIFIAICYWTRSLQSLRPHNVEYMFKRQVIIIIFKKKNIYKIDIVFRMYTFYYSFIWTNTMIVSFLIKII